jgi:hypothetical protein
MHVPINAKSPNNSSKWQMGFNSAFKGLNKWTQWIRKGSPTQEVVPAHPPAWQCQTPHLSAHKGGNCNNEIHCSPRPSLQSRFRTLLLPSFWSPEGYTPVTLFCGQRRAETQVAWIAATLQQSFTRPAYSVSCKGGKSVWIMEDLWENALKFVKNDSGEITNKMQPCNRIFYSTVH